MQHWLNRLPLTELADFFRERTLLSLTLAYIAGILLASLKLCRTEWIFPVLVLIFLALVFVALFSSWKASALYLLFFILLGIFLAGLHLEQPQKVYQQYYDHYVTIEGFISQEPEIRAESTRYYLQTEKIILVDQISDLDGKIILLNYGEQKILPYGQRVRIRGLLSFPEPAGNPDEFDYAQYLNRQGIGGIIYNPEIKLLPSRQGDFLLNLALLCKNRLVEVIDQTLPAEAAILFKSMALGLDSELNPKWRKVFSQAGVCHLLCVSGLHVGFILLLALALADLLQLVGRFKNILVILILFFYALMTGLNPPVVRATLMALVFLWGKSLGRLVDWPTSWSLAALVILLFSPLELFAVGFQLSFIATWGILYLTQPLKHFFSRFKRRSVWIAAPLAAQLASLPLIAIYFNILTLGALISNMLAVPLAGIIIPLGFTASLLGLICLPLAQVVQISTAFLLDILQFLIVTLNNVPGFYFFVAAPGLFWVSLWYAFLGIVGKILPHRPLALAHPTSISLARRLFIIVCPLIMNAVLFVPVLLPSGQLTLNCLDVGQGDSIFLELPDGKNLLIDCGGNTGDLVQGSSYAGQRVSNYLKSRGVNKIDYLILSHSHEDHAAGWLEISQDFKVDKIWICPTELNDPATPFAYYLLLEQAKKAGSEIQELWAGDKLNLDEQIQVEVLNPVRGLVYSDPNEASLVLLFQYDQQSLLFGGDMGATTQKRITGDLEQKITVYKVGHHGSANTDPKFLQQIAPQIALISCGLNNSYGHPAPEVLELLKQMGTIVYRTDLQGAIRVVLDGKSRLEAQVNK